MQPVRSTLPGNNRLPIYPISTLRVAEKEQVTVRILQAHGLGINTHWLRGRSEYCPGDSCPPGDHRKGSVWKAYAPVEKYLQSKNKWEPWLLEITENLDHEMSGVVKRGQVWQLEKLHLPGRQSLALSGLLIEECNPDTFPQPFDFWPVLVHLFHRTDIRLDVENPMPRRPVATLSEGEIPANYRTAPTQPEEKPSPEQLERFRQMRLKISATANGIGEISRNGKSH